MAHSPAKRFAVSSAVAFTLLLALGWLTGVRHVMHGTLIALTSVAFLPFVLLAAALAALIALTFILALAANDHPGTEGLGEPVAHGWLWFTPRYYRFLARRSNAVTVGAAAGVAAAALALWALLSVFVVPHDLDTVARLAGAREAVEHARGGFPAPDAAGHLVVGGAALVDGFGRPFVYETEGHGLMASYRLRSLGFNGLRGGDDLCLDGATKLEKLALAVKNLTHRPELADVHALACD